MEGTIAGKPFPTCTYPPAQPAQPLHALRTLLTPLTLSPHQGTTTSWSGRWTRSAWRATTRANVRQQQATTQRLQPQPALPSKAAPPSPPLPPLRELQPQVPTPPPPQLESCRAQPAVPQGLAAHRGSRSCSERVTAQATPPPSPGLCMPSLSCCWTLCSGGCSGTRRRPMCRLITTRCSS